MTRTYWWTDRDERYMPDDTDLLEQEAMIVQLAGGNVDSVTEW